MITPDTQSNQEHIRSPLFRAENLERIFTKTEDYRVGGIRM